MIKVGDKVKLKYLISDNGEKLDSSTSHPTSKYFQEVIGVVRQYTLGAKYPFQVEWLIDANKPEYRRIDRTSEYKLEELELYGVANPNSKILL